ncbi:MAG: M42 family metallopeptidase [Treponema sp.]|nr:M42 family metallopeptidase [Treponema sp.]
MQIDMDYVVNLTLSLLKIPSIAGHCTEAVELCAKEFEKFGIPYSLTNKKAIIGTWKGKNDERHRIAAAHVDTLGATVRQIKNNGRLRLFALGGFDWRSFAGENCTVRTMDGKLYRGTLLPDRSARHAIPENLRNEVHDMDNVEVRLDIRTDKKESTEALGIHSGDPVFFEPRSEFTETGYLKSRFLDDKLGVAIIFGAIKAMTENKQTPEHTTHFYISNYEEIGHGTPVIPEKTVEIAAVDLGVVSETTSASEHAVTIIARDSATPYDREGTLLLKQLAERENIPYKIDSYLFYASDASVSVRSGRDLRCVCFGPGGEATHHYERTHVDSVRASTQLLAAWLKAPIAD